MGLPTVSAYGTGYNEYHGKMGTQGWLPDQLPGSYLAAKVGYRLSYL